MYLLPSLRPKTLEEIARQPDDTERLAQREAEQIAKLKEIRDYKRDALTPGQPPNQEPEDESEEEDDEGVEVEEEEDDEADVTADEEEEDAGIEMDDPSLSDDGMEEHV
ncbi:g11344 [Coccomyxa viridis]|uniref:G11344 protein n=1 Tax=Coccomyxa viridis TaxID=1274662 RepID=A0ABP1G7P2_9CHLO